MTSLPTPDLIERDPLTIERSVFDSWAAKGGRALAPTDEMAIALKTVAYRETLIRMAIQDVGLKNLLRFAEFPLIDYLGEFLQTPRLAPQAATSTLRVTLPVVHGSNVLIPSGTRRKTKDGRFVFETVADLTIIAGELTGDVGVIAQEVGVAANGYIAGQIVTELDPLPNSATAENLTESEGGSALESTENYRTRLLLAPDQYSTAGAGEGYRFHARRASSAVADVSVEMTEPGMIEIAVLSTSGVPGPELLATVAAALDPEERRPMSDDVDVVACTEVTWALVAELTLFSGADAETTRSASQAAADAHVAKQRLLLGRDVVRDQLKSKLQVSGVYSVNLTSPAADIEVTSAQWANCTGVDVTVAGFAEDRE